MVYPLILFIGSINDVCYKRCYTYNDCFLHIYTLLVTIGVQGAQRPKRPLNFKPFYFLGFLFFNRSRISSAVAVKIAVKIARTICHIFSSISTSPPLLLYIIISRSVMFALLYKSIHIAYTNKKKGKQYVHPLSQTYVNAMIQASLILPPLCFV